MKILYYPFRVGYLELVCQRLSLLLLYCRVAINFWDFMLLRFMRYLLENEFQDELEAYEKIGCFKLCGS